MGRSAWKQSILIAPSSSISQPYFSGPCPSGFTAAHTEEASVFPPTISWSVYVLKSLIFGVSPDSSHFTVNVPAGIEAPGAGDVNLTSASTVAARVVITGRRVEERIVGGERGGRRAQCVRRASVALRRGDRYVRTKVYYSGAVESRAGSRFV